MNKNINERAIAVDISAPAGQIHRKSRKMRENTIATFGADAKSITGSVKLLECDEFKHLVNCQKAVIRYIEPRMGVYCGDEVISVNFFFKIKQDLDELIAESEKALNDLIAKYDDLVREDLKKLGRLNDGTIKYPTSESIRERYRVKMSFKPLADITTITFRGSNISDVERVQLTNAVNQNHEAERKAFIVGLMGKIVKGLNPLSNQKEKGESEYTGNGLEYAIQRLKEIRNNGEGSFKDATFNNVLVAVDIVEELNIFEDEEVARVVNDIRNLFKVEPESVRSNAMTRDTFIDNAEKELDKISKLMDGFMS